MVSPTRRAFLTGRRPPRTPWQALSSRLRRHVEGSLTELDGSPGHEQGRFSPASESEVMLARRLAAEEHVGLGLADVPLAGGLVEGPVLWLAPGRGLARCERLEPGSPLWFVQPGCLLGELEAQGFRGFAGLPAGMTVAAWLADRRLHDWKPGRTAESGVQHAAVLLADGRQARLGPFGEANRQPLDSLRLQQLIPALFQLMARPENQSLLQSDRWAGRYRLDALQPQAGAGINLAHLLLGHGGDLGWVEWLVLDERLQAGDEPQDWRWPHSDLDMGLRAEELDMQVKALFDPSGLFPHPTQDL